MTEEGREKFLSELVKEIEDEHDTAAKRIQQRAQEDAWASNRKAIKALLGGK